MHNVQQYDELIADMFQHIFKLRYNNRHSFCFESYSQDIESFDQSTLCLFLWICGLTGIINLEEKLESDKLLPMFRKSFTQEIEVSKN